MLMAYNAACTAPMSATQAPTQAAASFGPRVTEGRTCPAVSVPRVQQNGLGVVAAGALAGFLYLQRREAAAAQAAADAQLAGQRASLAGLRTQARPMRRWRSPHAQHCAEQSVNSWPGGRLGGAASRMRGVLRRYHRARTWHARTSNSPNLAAGGRGDDCGRA